MTQERPILAYFGHHKCASSWLALICSEVCRDLKLRRDVAWSEEVFSHDLKSFIENRRPEFIIYTNADFELVDAGLPGYRGFHVVRDPRDMCVSGYFSHRNTHHVKSRPLLAAHREVLRSVSKREGLLLDMDYMGKYFQHMLSWPSGLEHVLELRMEDVTASPYSHLLDAFTFLGLVTPEDHNAGSRLRFLVSKACRRIEASTGGIVSLPFTLDRLPAERLLGIVWEQDFKKKAGGRKPGEEDLESHYRKGVSGDWRNHFEPEHVAYFKERYNEVLLRYGYETTEDWS